jgi:hypothetical protein
LSNLELQVSSKWFRETMRFPQIRQLGIEQFASSGIKADPTAVANYLKSLLKSDGLISENTAELLTSILGPYVKDGISI